MPSLAADALSSMKETASPLLKACLGISRFRGAGVPGEWQVPFYFPKEVYRPQIVMGQVLVVHLP